mmetsp:Transcript_28511/g.72148  ORF Transcript_28511/g.72148 Transcript_28511/m.72148 type:complete len:265 (+) Transcript_28511:478-1272(+)
MALGSGVGGDGAAWMNVLRTRPPPTMPPLQRMDGDKAGNLCSSARGVGWEPAPSPGGGLAVPGLVEGVAASGKMPASSKFSGSLGQNSTRFCRAGLLGTSPPRSVGALNANNGEGSVFTMPGDPRSSTFIGAAFGAGLPGPLPPPLPRRFSRPGLGGTMPPGAAEPVGRLPEPPEEGSEVRLSAVLTEESPHRVMASVSHGAPSAYEAISEALKEEPMSFGSDCERRRAGAGDGTGDDTHSGTAAPNGATKRAASRDGVEGAAA